MQRNKKKKTFIVIIYEELLFKHCTYSHTMATIRILLCSRAWARQKLLYALNSLYPSTKLLRVYLWKYLILIYAKTYLKNIFVIHVNRFVLTNMRSMSDQSLVITSCKTGIYTVHALYLCAEIVQTSCVRGFRLRYRISIIRAYNL